MSGLDLGSLRRAALVALVAALCAFGVFAAQSQDASVPAAAAVPAPVEDGAAELVRELPALRTQTSKTYVDADGRLTARIFSGSVHHQVADGSWEPIDNTLVKTRSGFRNKANNYAVELPKSLSSAVKVSTGERWVTFRLVGAKGAATTSGAVATYERALPGVDVRYTAGADTVKEDLILASAASRRAFSFDVRAAAGLTAKLRESGAVDFVDAEGVVRKSFAAPIMIDAAGVESRDAAFTLEPASTGWTLRLTLSDAWLEDPARQWPVTVDPQVVPLASPDCSLDADTPETSGCGASTLKLGTSGGYEHRALLRFDVQGVLPVDVDVFSATMGVYATGHTNSTAASTPVAAHRVTRSWTTAASWNRHDGANRWGAPGGDHDVDVEQDWRGVGGTAGVGRWYWFKLDDVVGEWAKGKRSQQGVMLRPRKDATIPANVISLAASEYSDATKRPTLDVRYNRRIGVQRGYAMESQQLSDRISLAVNPANGNLMVSQRDLTVPGGLGPDLTISRSYNSLYPVDPAYGIGWTMDTANDVRLYDHGNGHQYLDGPTGWTAAFKEVYENNAFRYRTPKGFDATLVENADQSHTLTFHQSQDKWHFEPKSDGFARLTKTEDRNGRAITYAYYGTTNNVQTITDNQNRTTTFGTYSGTKVTTMTDPAGRVYNYGYTGDNLISYTSPSGTGSGTTSYEYGSQGMTKITTPGGRVTRIEYWPVGGPNAGKVKKIIRVTDTTAQTGPTTSFDYVDRRDGSSDATVTDESDHATRYVFNEDGRPEKITDPLGNVQSQTYNSNANVNTYTAPGNSSGSASATFNYDSDNNPTGSSTPVKAGEAGGRSLTDSAGYPGLTSSGGAVTGGKYLPNHSINEQNTRTNFDYTTGGNPANITGLDAAGAQTSKVMLDYDPNGLPGKLIRSSVGNGARVVATGEPDPTTNSVTKYEYDTGGNLTKITPPAPIGATTFTYNSGQDLALSRISSVAHPTWSEAFTYDTRDRVLTVTYGTSNTITNTYDLDGNLTQVADSVNGTRTMTYDSLNRLKTQTGPGTTSFTYGYDLASNLTSLQDNYGTTEYGYDAANRMVSVYLPGVPTPVKYTLNEKGHPNKITWPNGNVTEQEFNDAGQMKNTCVALPVVGSTCAASTSKRLHLIYTYGAIGSTRQTALQDLVQNATGSTSTFTRYCYDPLERLLRAENASTSGATDCTAANGEAGSFFYEYDDRGNLKKRTVDGSSVTSFGYDIANRLCWKASGSFASSCTPTPTGAATYSYNTAGNETAQTNAGSGSRTSSTYAPSNPPSSRNQLSSFTVGGFAKNLEHVGAGQSDLLAVGGVARRNSILGVLSIGTDTYQRDESGGLVSQSTANGREYFHMDALGSVRALTGSAGTATRTFNYDPYGTATSTDKPGPTTSRFGYASGDWIDQGSLYHFGERYYDPQIHRWTTPDPLLNHADLRQANRYAYVGGDPVNNLDPDGLVYGRGGEFGVGRGSGTGFNPLRGGTQYFGPTEAKRRVAVVCLVASIACNAVGFPMSRIHPAVEKTRGTPDSLRNYRRRGTQRQRPW